MTTYIFAPAPGSVRALITELAQLEDAVRSHARTYAADSLAGPVPDPELVALHQREAVVLDALRRVTAATR